ncbi:TetR family transcriptional regulator [Murinocardiopsis flavida]|uniref:TetR family transcriptional regulator n=1 Tax=Murinocardiopsis flavida TaxID=645275 RepID=A0A2P8CMN5_9ACTN|nr:TetR/AcrR family transcriptional regulator [Murinocardiopsis flavida]PSK86221.1 TetR family transcriptional regulator [Murinocardiopsis flavida]
MRRSPEDAARTRSALLRAALAVFAERGYAAATLAGIAARAGLTRGAVYHHFTDKAELFLASIEENWGAAAGPIWAHLDDTGAAPRERIRAFIVAFCTALEEDEVMSAAFALSMQGVDAPELASGLDGKRRVMQAWADQLTVLLAEAAEEEGEEEGAWPGAVPPESGAIAIISALNGAAATWVACPDLFSPARQARPLADAVLDGALPRRPAG